MFYYILIITHHYMLFVVFLDNSNMHFGNGCYITVPTPDQKHVLVVKTDVKALGKGNRSICIIMSHDSELNT